MILQNHLIFINELVLEIIDKHSIFNFSYFQRFFQDHGYICLKSQQRNKELLIFDKCKKLQYSICGFFKQLKLIFECRFVLQF